MRRLKTALKLSEDIRAVSAPGIRRRHPDYTAAQVRWALLRRQFGDELFGRVYPEAPFLEPWCSSFCVSSPSCWSRWAVPYMLAGSAPRLNWL